MKKAIIYHAKCTDGAGAMWSAWKNFQDDAEYVAVGKNSKSQQKVLKKCHEADVIYMCDCMLEMDTIESLLQRGKTIYMLDHHISNMNDLADTNLMEKYPNHLKDFNDLKRSGAGIAWDFFQAGEKRPSIINYVEDFDLWNWALPEGQSIHTLLSQFNWNTEDEIINKFNEWETMNPGQLAALGTPLVNYKTDLMERNMAHIARAKVRIVSPTEFSRIETTYDVPILNANQFISETGNIMAQGEDFALIWQVMGDGRVRMSLRSDDNGFDVSSIAKHLGEQGGGHIHAAGTRFDSIEVMLESIQIYKNSST
jgi:oligoribonuclease NrnB/cAMP/cGMP phosphodiesterase (DHH superfamily)